MSLLAVLSFFLSTQTISNYISLKPTNTSNNRIHLTPFSRNYSGPNDLQEKQSFGQRTRKEVIGRTTADIAGGAQGKSPIVLQEDKKKKKRDWDELSESINDLQCTRGMEMLFEFKGDAGFLKGFKS